MVERDNLRRSIQHLGIQPGDYRVLKLLPLIYVAWADGKMGGVQNERIHSFASRQFELSAHAMAVLDGWLKTPPSASYIHEALHDMFLLAQAVDDGEFDFSELPSLISYAEGIARSTAEALDQPSAVTPEQELALAEIARELHIDHGQSWGKLLRELN
jgi:hypothetical protein